MLLQHIALKIRILLDERYPNHWLGWGGLVLSKANVWPPRSQSSWLLFMRMWKMLYIRKHHPRN